jgi:hypothetical protein
MNERKEGGEGRKEKGKEGRKEGGREGGGGRKKEIEEGIME